MSLDNVVVDLISSNPLKAASVHVLKVLPIPWCKFMILVIRVSAFSGFKKQNKRNPLFPYLVFIVPVHHVSRKWLPFQVKFFKEHGRVETRVYPVFKLKRNGETLSLV